MYGLTRLILASTAFVEISEQEYVRFKSAKKVLNNIVAIEEKYDTAIENYRELEEELANVTFDYMLYEREPNFIFTTGNTINRRIVNVLTSFRLYNDHTEHHFSSLFGKASSQFQVLEDIKSKQYDSFIEYRVMEALRNYVQHRGYPLIGYSVGSKWIGSDADKRSEHRVVLTLDTDELRQDGVFKRKVLDEIMAVGEDPDLKLCIRKYVECLSDIHGVVRSLTTAETAIADQAMIDALSTYENAAGEDPDNAIYAIAKDETGRIVEKISLHLQQTDYRKLYEFKNKALVNLAKRVVTSK